MLAKRKGRRTKPDIIVVHERPPLIHQLLPHLLRLLHPNRPIIYQIPDLHPHLDRQLPKALRRLQLLGPPLPPLSGYVLRRDDLDMRIDEEERQYLAVARFRGVGKTEGLDAVLKNVGEGDEAAFFREDVAELLNAGFSVLASKYDL